MKSNKDKIEKEDALLNTMNQISDIAGKSIIAAIPVFGSPIVGIIDSVKSNCLEKRNDEWFKALDERLDKVEYDIEKIGNDEFFTSAFIKASEIAAKTHENEKRDYLANAVINSIDVSSDEEMTKMILLEIIDKYTSLHIRLLDYLDNPRKYECPEVTLCPSASPVLLIEHNKYFSGIDKDLLKKVINDLNNDGLISIDTNSLNIMMTVDNALKQRTTKLGRELINYISKGKQDT